MNLFPPGSAGEGAASHYTSPPLARKAAPSRTWYEGGGAVSPHPLPGSFPIVDYEQIPLGAQIPGPPGIPSTVGQHAKPSSQGLSVPEMHLQPALRQGPAMHIPPELQKPEQHARQFAPKRHVAGQPTPSALQNPPKHSPGAVHVPAPPGRSPLFGQQTKPATQFDVVPVVH